MENLGISNEGVAKRCYFQNNHWNIIAENLEAKEFIESALKKSNLEYLYKDIGDIKKEINNKLVDITYTHDAKGLQVEKKPEHTQSSSKAQTTAKNDAGSWRKRSADSNNSEYFCN